MVNNLNIIVENIDTGCIACGCGENIKKNKSVNFEEFFEVMAKKILEERRFSDNIIFESSIK